MKRFVAAALTATLLLSCAAPAFAAGDQFPKTTEYKGFADVPATEWYSATVKECVETGLMKGTDKGFEPAKIMTRGELIAIAARILEKSSGELIVMGTPLPGQEVPWYTWYTDYLTRAGVTGLENPEQNATRGDFVALLGQVTADDALPALNKITALPDTADKTVLRFYNAGILAGSDDYGTFHASSEISRAETATMVARFTDASLRETFTPKEKPPQEEQVSIAREVLGVEPETTILTVGTHKVMAEDYVLSLLQVILDEDQHQIQQTGQMLDWSAEYSVGNLNDYFKQIALNSVVANQFVLHKSEELGCLSEELSGKLTSEAGFDAFVQQNDILRAKHILIPTVDLTSTAQTPPPLSDEAQAAAKVQADNLVAMLLANPTEAYFTKLMQEFSKDGGLATAPNGYVFQKGEMVPEFEAATRGLAIGKISAPVKSTFGYHIILRLDPKLDDSVTTSYHQEALGLGMEEWLKVNEIRGTQLYTSLDAHTLYKTALPILQAAGQEG